MELLKEYGSRIAYFESVDSTNRVLRDMAIQGAESGTVVIAGSQTMGRGRLGRSFVSHKGKGIYMSYLFCPDCPPENSVCLTAMTAVAVCKAIERVCNVNAGIKWVNDIVLNGRKICGILTESVFSENKQKMIIGIGVNVNNVRSDFEGELYNKASSLMCETGNRQSISIIASEIIKELDIMTSSQQDIKKCYLDYYKERCVSLNKDALTISGTEQRQCFVRSIDDDFALNVIYTDGSIGRISTGEVSIRGLYGYI